MSLDVTEPSLSASVQVSVVMPAHNEAGYLASSVSCVIAGLRARGIAGEVIVVENGSTDTTLALARELATADESIVVTSLTRADYGAAMRRGILMARGEMVAIFDVDYFDLDFLDQALPVLRDAGHGDPPALVVASKRAPGAHDTRSWARRAVTAGFAAILRHGFGLHVSDTHGMKVMRRDVVVPVVRQCRNDTDLFDTELVLRLDRGGRVVAELPVTVKELRPSRTPIATRVARTLVGLVRLRIELGRAEHR